MREHKQNTPEEVAEAVGKACEITEANCTPATAIELRLAVFQAAMQLLAAKQVFYSVADQEDIAPTITVPRVMLQ